MSQPVMHLQSPRGGESAEVVHLAERNPPAPVPADAEGSVLHLVAAVAALAVWRLIRGRR